MLGPAAIHTRDTVSHHVQVAIWNQRIHRRSPNVRNVSPRPVFFQFNHGGIMRTILNNLYWWTEGLQRGQTRTVYAHGRKNAALDQDLMSQPKNLAKYDSSISTDGIGWSFETKKWTKLWPRRISVTFSTSRAYHRLTHRCVDENSRVNLSESIGPNILIGSHEIRPKWMQKALANRHCMQSICSAIFSYNWCYSLA